VENSPWSGEDIEVDDIGINGPDITNEKFDRVEVRVPKRMTNIGKVTVLATLSPAKRGQEHLGLSADKGLQRGHSGA
jgi:hypothetical protein